MKQHRVMLDKPIHVGFTVLEIRYYQININLYMINLNFYSKLIMAEFWYQVILPRFGENNVRLLYTGNKYIYMYIGKAG